MPEIVILAPLSTSRCVCVCVQVLFPDVYDLPEDPLSGGEEDRLKSAPQGSLSRQLATTLCIINNDHGESRARPVGGVC